MAYPKPGRGYMKPESKNKHKINAEIRVPEVRLIDADGSQAGIKPIAEALAMAKEKALDLVEVAPEAVPPVCKILAYSKFKYDLEKKLRESRKHQKAGLLKEVRFSPIIGQHDLDVKIRHAQEFLKAHDKVRFTVLFRGRQNKHEDIGLRLLQSVQVRLADIATVESHPVKDRNRMSMTMAPKR